MGKSIAFDSIQPLIEKIITNIEKVIIGKREVVELSLTALLAEGHVLLEDVPGVGKTLLVRTLAKSVSAEFNRIQFTPDLLPSDLTGLSIYNQQDQTFVFKEGPLMGHIILADEINRTSPKTQSALLEGMEEGSVTVDGTTHKLPHPFFVMATQNPIEYEGTYPLPEAQLDRFLLKLNMGYPTHEEEIELMDRFERTHPFDEVSSVITLSELVKMQRKVKEIFIDKAIKHYIVDVVNETRNHPFVALGVSPRGSLSLMRASQSLAYIRGRDYVIPDDVKYLIPHVLTHRIVLHSEAAFSGKIAEEVIVELIEKIPIPVMKERHLL